MTILIDTSGSMSRRDNHHDRSILAFKLVRIIPSCMRNCHTKDGKGRLIILYLQCMHVIAQGIA